MNNDSNNKKVAEELPEYKLFKDHFKQLSSEIDKWDASESETFIEKCKTLLVYAENQMQIQIQKDREDNMKTIHKVLDVFCKKLYNKSFDEVAGIPETEPAAEKS